MPKNNEPKDIEPYMTMAELDKMAELIDQLSMSKNKKEYLKNLEKMEYVFQDPVTILKLIQTSYMACVLLTPLIQFRRMVEEKTNNKMQSPEFDRDLAEFERLTGIMNDVKLETYHSNVNKEGMH